MSGSASPSLKDLVSGVDQARAAPGAPGMFVIRTGGETKTVAAAELTRLRGELRGVLSGGYRRIASRIAGGKAGHEDMAENREKQRIVAGISAILGGVSFPPLTIWDQPEALLGAGQSALKSNELTSAAGILEPADSESEKAN